MSHEGNDRPIEINRHYFIGRDHFKRLAKQAYDLLIQLPADIINVYPDDWKIYEDHLGTFRVRRIDLASDLENLDSGFSFCTYDAILPPGGSPAERWLGYLYWLGWGGEVPGLKSERRTWIGNSDYPWYASKEEFNTTIGLLPPMVKCSFEDMMHYYSVIENVFLCSALAINELESRLTQVYAVGHFSAKPSFPDMSGSNEGAGITLPNGSAESTSTTFHSPNHVKNKVFISYSHKDKRFLDDLQTHLKPFIRSGSITAWSDRQIETGSKWFDEIQKALHETSIAVLLVTPHFLASDFIHTHELGPLLKEAETGGVKILWILIRDCSYGETPLQNYQALVSPPKKPFANMKAERDSAWREACEAISKAAK